MSEIKIILDWDVEVLSQMIAPEAQRFPEHDLIAATIMRAVADAFGYCTNVENIRLCSAQAQKWIWCPVEIDEEEPEWSFAWCCDSLGIDPNRLRRGLEKQIIKNGGLLNTRMHRGRMFICYHLKNILKKVEVVNETVSSVDGAGPRNIHAALFGKR